MKKVISLLLSVIMTVTSVIVLPLGTSAAVSKTTVDLSKTHQTMKGFGASACWWAKDVGGWNNVDDVMSLLYDKENGIGLNIYRYNLGAGSDKDEINYRNDRWAESFMNADGTYDWSRDANAQKALASAKKFAGDDMRVTLFCNSAPIYLTKNGCGIANEYWWDCNLDKSNFDAFAQYGYDCVDYFQNQGYRVVDISPVNEPYGHWCRDNQWFPTLDEEGNKTYDENGNEQGYYEFYNWANQEGCYYRKEEVRDLTTAFIKKFKDTEVSQKGCKVSLFEANDMITNPDANVNSDLESYLDTLLSTKGSNFSSTSYIRNNVDTITMHSYWTSRADKQATAELMKNTYKGKYSVAQTEYCQMQADIHSGVYDLVKDNMSSGLTMEYGSALANVIYDDITILDAVEWDWWVAVAYGGYTDGLVYVNPETHEIDTSKRLYTLGNFSKFTEEGSVRVDSVSGNANLKSVAFKNPDSTVSIVFINDTASAQQTSLSINGLGSSCFGFTSYVTDKTRNLTKYQTRSSSSSNVTVPANSVTTVVVTPCNHSYKNVVTKATTSKNGKITPTCTICGGTKTATAISYPKTITLAATSYQYDGKVKATPKVTVKDASGKTISASNYTVTPPSGRKVVGRYPVKITFKGNYSGTVTKYFYIRPKNTTFTLSKGSKKITVKLKKYTTQTTGYQIQYSTKSDFSSAKTVNVKNTVTSKTLTGLAGNKTYYVRVRTYRTVKLDGKNTNIYSSWAKKSIKTNK